MSKTAEVWAFVLPDDLTDVRICHLYRSDSGRCEWQFYKVTQERLSEEQDIPFHSPDFLSDLDIAPGSKIIISCPARFCIHRHVRMPPVDNKKLAAVIKYEAIQNIPFPLESVEWDTLLSEDHSEVLISAARNFMPAVTAFNGALKNKNVRVDIVTPTFPALARLVQGEGARMVLNGMKECVIVRKEGTNSTMWQRPLAVGTGDEATRLENLASELNRSLGFWQTFNRGVEVESIILIGDEWTTQSVSFLQVNTNIRTVKACECVPSLMGQQQDSPFFVADEDVEVWALAQFTTDKSINLIRQRIAQQNRDYLKKVMVRTLVAVGIVLLVLIMGM